MIQGVENMTFEFSLPEKVEDTAVVLGSSAIIITSKKDGDEDDAIDHVNNVSAAVWQTMEEMGADANCVVVDVLDSIKDDEDDGVGRLRFPF
jgi:hypothetical protein